MNSSLVFGVTVFVGAVAGTVVAGTLSAFYKIRLTPAHHHAKIAVSVAPMSAALNGSRSGETAFPDTATNTGQIGRVLQGPSAAGADQAVEIADFRSELLTDRERAILEARARASGRDHYRLSDFLTARERESLRHRQNLPADDGEVGS